MKKQDDPNEVMFVFATKPPTIMTQAEFDKLPPVRVLHIPATNPRDEGIGVELMANIQSDIKG